MSNRVKALLAVLTGAFLSGVTFCGATGTEEPWGSIRTQTSALLQAKEEQRFTSTSSSGSLFGDVLSLSADGNTAVISRPGKTSTDLYIRSGVSWMLKDSFGAKGFSSYLGIHSAAAVSADGKTIILGAQERDVATGYAEIHERATDGWYYRKARLALSGGASAMRFFGYAVALSATGDVAAVGNPALESAGWSGEVHMYRRTEESPGTVKWVHAETIASPTDFSISTFGRALSLARDGRTLIVSNEYQAAAWEAPRASGYVFELGASLRPTRSQRLVPADSKANDYSQSTVALSLDGQTAVLGVPAWEERLEGKLRRGAAYVFTRSSGTGTWSQAVKLVASDLEQDSFGHAAACSEDGSSILVGSPYAGDGALRTGAAYVFLREGTTWTQQTKLRASDKTDGTCFGGAIALSGNGRAALVSAPVWYGVSQPQVYSFSVLRSNGDRCSSGAECASGFCTDGVCCNNECGGGIDSDCQACSKARGAASDGTCGAVKRDQVCRASQGICDPAEVCDGTAVACPSQVLLTGTVCRGAVGVCDAEEKCNGVNASCPTDRKAPREKICRPAAGACDQAEFCDGARVDCPSDQFRRAETVCRAKEGPCDIEEKCSGESPKCPEDAVVAKGEVCKEGRKGEDARCDPDDVCDGTTTMKQCKPIQLNPEDSCSDDPMKPKKCDPELRCIGK